MDAPLTIVQRRTTRANSVREGDLGYFDTAEFAEEAEADEYFFSRYKGAVKLYTELGRAGPTPVSVGEGEVDCWVKWEPCIGCEHA